MFCPSSLLVSSLLVSSLLSSALLASPPLANTSATHHYALSHLPAAHLSAGLTSPLSSPFLSTPKHLMEGAFNKVFLASQAAPAQSYTFFLDMLGTTIRCVAKSNCFD